jgi:uncharacterized membrane protein
MHKKFLSYVKPLLKSLLMLGLVLTLAFGHPSDALAASSGGRIGGGSFRAPSRTYAPPSRTYAPPGGGYGYYPGGGFGFPFVFPFFGIGGGAFGGLFTILIFFAIANFLLQSFRRVGGGDTVEGYSANPTVSIAKLQVGLLSEARELQTDLNRIAETANTNSSEGLAQVLQETSLALLRHPEYWAYAGGEAQQARLESAEAQFNRLVLAERSKLAKETLSNVGGRQIKAADVAGSLPAGETAGALANQAPGEYIVATVLVAAEGNLKLPTVKNTEDLRLALQQIGGVSPERLLALEVLWEPQAEGDTLTSDELISEYPDLRLI